MATEKQLEANRRNALKSQGPRTQDGKERSKRNALKHGLTAETIAVLPGEDQGALDGRIERWLDEIGARSEVEATIIRRAAILSWKLDRAERHEAAVLTRKIREQAEVDRTRHRERLPQVIARLLPTVDEIRQGGFDPTPAGKLLQEIESSAEGCRCMLGCWDRLRQAVDRRRPWTHSEEMAILRLTEQGPDAIDDPAALDLIVASRVLMRPNGVLDADHFDPGPYALKLNRDAIREACRRRPRNYDEAYQILSTTIEKGIARLEIVKKLRERDGDDFGSEESTAVASFDASTEGERLRRYQTTTHREMIRSVESVSKLRLQAVRLEKEESSERFVVSVQPEAEPEPAVLRNEPNPAGVDEPRARCPQESRSADLGARSARPQPPEASERQPVVLRNEPNFDLDPEESIEIPELGQGAERTPIPLRAAS